VDVSASAAAASGADKLPAWSEVPSAEVEAKGHGAASMITSALAGLGLTPNPWAKLGGTVMRRKPHKAADRAYQELLNAQVCTRVCVCVYVCACLCVCVCLCMCTCVLGRLCADALHW
jgi:hypothetical protein